MRAEAFFSHINTEGRVYMFRPKRSEGQIDRWDYGRSTDARNGWDGEVSRLIEVTPMG